MSVTANAVPTPTLPQHHETITTGPLPPSPETNPRIRNQAPGIPDRRRSLRPSRAKASPRQSLNKNSGISIRVAMAENDGDAEEVKVLKEKDDSDDEKPVCGKNGGHGKVRQDKGALH